MSDFKAIAAGIEKFDGTNWPTWSFAIQAALMFMDAWPIAEGTETRPVPATTGAPTAAEIIEIDSWNKRERQGRSLLVLVVQPAIYQSIDLTKTLAENWAALKTAYGIRTGLNAWVDFRSYIAATLDTTSPFSKQIDALSELRAKIVQGGLTITEQLHALVVLGSLPATFEVVQSSILGSYSDLTTITFTDVRARILAEELRQTSGSSSAIYRPGTSTTKGTSKGKKKDKTSVTCHWCGKTGHYLNDCMAKKAGLSKEDCKDDKKRKDAVKEYAKKGEKSTAKVSAIIESPYHDNDAPVDTAMNESTEPFVFYIARTLEWMIDSGATEHITPYASDLSDYTTVVKHRSLSLADQKSKCQVRGQGVVNATALVDGKPVHIRLEGVLHVPEIGKRFISTRKLDQKGYEIAHSHGMAIIKKLSTGQICGKGRLAVDYDNEYYLTLKLTPPPRVNAMIGYGIAGLSSSTINVPIEILHQRYGHLAWSTLQRVAGLPATKEPRSLSTCEGCQLGKQTRRSYTSSETRATQPFQLIHMDLCGPMQTKSIQGNTYFLMIVDDYTSAYYVFFIKTKDQAFEAFKTFHKYVKTALGYCIRNIRSDRGGEFLSKSFEAYIQEHGLGQQLTAPDTPMQNGRAERANRTIVESGRAMLHHAGMTYGFWEFAVSTAAYIRNRSPHRSNSYVSPFERLMGYAPETAYFKVFGCLAYRHIHKDHRRKLDPKAEKLVFVGYDDKTKGYRLWNGATHRVVISSDVIFEETIFPLRRTPLPTPTKSPTPEPMLITDQPEDKGDISPEIVEIDLLDENDDHRRVPPPADPAPQHEPPPRYPAPRPPQALMGPGMPGIQPAANIRPQMGPELGPALVEPANVNPVDEGPPRPQLRRSGRPPHPQRAEQNASLDRERTPGAEGQGRWPHTLGRLRAVWDNSDQAFLNAAQTVNTTILGDPQQYRDAMATPEAEKWKIAMDEEMRCLEEHGVYKLVDLPEGRQPIQCRWVFILKRDTDNRPKRYRARLVAKGFSQIQGIDYNETFAPVARHDTLRLLLALAATFDFEVHGIDIKSAYLHGELEEEIYMVQPEGFVKEGQESKVWRLLKALYGLKQGGRQWYNRFRRSMKNWGFSEYLAGDIAIFSKLQNNGNLTIVLVYVDDMSIFASTIDLVNEFKKQVGTEYKFTDMGELSHFLGLRITRNRKEKKIAIDQQHYIHRIIGRFKLQDAHPKKTPLSSSTKLTASTEDTIDIDRKHRYQSMIGSLMYAMLGSRPDICFAVNKLSQYGSNPDEQHLRAAIRVFEYLKQTENYRLIYNGNEGSDLFGYSDSDWASDIDTRRSTTGYIFKTDSGTISWASSKQRTVALSSVEAEYMALTESAKQAMWTLQILENLKFDVDLPFSIYSDSEGARAISENNVFHKRTKHIEIRYHFIREKIQNKTIQVKEVQSSNNVADIFTKALPESTHMRHVHALGLGTTIEGEC